MPLPEASAASPLFDLLRGVSRRLRLEVWLIGAASAAAAAALAWLAASWLPWPGTLRAAGAAIAAAAVLLWRVASRRRAWRFAAAARAIERAAPGCRNLVVTAEELLRHPERARPPVQQRVFEEAGRVSAGLRPAVVVPLGRPALIAVVALASMSIVFAMPRRAVRTAGTRAGTPQAVGPVAAALHVTATITPPAYTGDAPQSMENPDHVETLEGSALRLDLRGSGSWRVRVGSTVVGERALDPRAAPPGGAIELTLTESGYIAIEPAAEGTAGDRRLIPVAVRPDRAPSIRVKAPGKDLLVPDLTRVVAVNASATDDFGLAALELKYTRISGSGEQFDFQEGVIPLEITRASDRAWEGEGELAIARLGLTPGDSLVYRVVGRDRRPGEAGLASSDTYFIEVAGPGQVALEGFDLPPDRERYALSQQMIVLKLERLRARERSIDRATLEQEVANLAAEQRAVRANFIFLTGGTVEDEEEEAEHSHEIQEGRLENSARREIGAAIAHMQRAEQGLGAVDTGAALPPARAAVEALQRAFGRNRYFLRTVPVRSRVDPARRLTGDLSEAAGWRRELFPAAEDPAAGRGRALLARLVELSPQIRRGDLPRAALTAFAEEAIAIDAVSPEWRSISRALIELRDGGSLTPAQRDQLVNRTARSVAAILQKSAAAAADTGVAADPLRSAWQDARERK